MKELAAAIALLLAISGQAAAALTSYDVFSAVPVVSTGNATSRAVELERAAGEFSIGAIAAGVGASMTIAWEVSADGTNWDTSSTSPNRVVISDLGTSYVLVGFDLPAAKWVRFKATGQGSNPSDAKVWVTFTFTEER